MRVFNAYVDQVIDIAAKSGNISIPILRTTPTRLEILRDAANECLYVETTRSDEIAKSAKDVMAQIQASTSPQEQMRAVSSLPVPVTTQLVMDVVRVMRPLARLDISRADALRLCADLGRASYEVYTEHSAAIKQLAGQQTAPEGQNLNRH
jgi:16S rRNA A1518/A1519 N6-dimethyltransferase RsmA/KsgA/DIM1 with predicted DNA glycosylase/AP lyase activity